MKPKVSKAAISQRLHEVAAGFTENVGQWDARAKFLSSTRNVDVWITSKGAVYDYYKMRSDGARKGQVVRMSFDGSKDSPVVPSGASIPGGAEYHINGRQPSGLAHRYTSVLQKDLYPGIDARYYVDRGMPRYDLIVAPQSDPASINVRFEGASGVKLKNGEVVLGTNLGTFKNARPVAYQDLSDGRHVVAANFELRSNGAIGIHLGEYDHSRTIVVDPLVYGSYYGGESGNDEVRNVVSDSDGTYLVGRTAAKDFPALTGPYGFNLTGGFDAFVAKLRGDAYVNVYSAYFGGTQNDLANFCTLDPFGNLWIAGRTYSTDFPGNGRDNIQFLYGDSRANGGTWRVTYNGRRSAPLPWNATPVQVFNALAGLMPAGSLKSVTAVEGTSLSDATYRIVSDGDVAPGVVGVINEDNLAGNQSVFGLAPHVETVVESPTSTRVSNNRTLPIGGFWTLTFTNGGTAATTAAMPANASAALVRAALSALTNLNNGTFTVTVSGGTNLTDGGKFHVSFFPQNAVVGVAPALESLTQNLQPKPTYSAAKFSDIFVMRWAKDSVKVLDPTGNFVQMFGGDGQETLAGFAVKQDDNPGPADDVLLGWAGDYFSATSVDTLPEVSGSQQNASWVARYSYNGGVFNKNGAASKWVEGFAVNDLGGFALDRDGNSYIAGDVGFNGFNDVNPTASGNFPTTPGIYLNGDKLRFADAFFRKYDQLGQIAVSGILGGNGNDSIGGRDFNPHNNLDVDPFGLPDNVGSAIYVDQQKNIFVTGISASFNFPRTPGVFGETFDANANVFATRISPDGTTLVFSTNLKTSGPVIPAGIVADPSGNVYVAGTAHPRYVDFPGTNGQQDGDPNQPVATAFPTIPLSGPLDPDYTSPATPEFPTTEGWIIGLNQTATTELYGSWVGGFLDEMVYGPYVDRFGDVWLNGWTDSFRNYVRFSSTGTPTVYNTNGSLPAAYISPLAFKATPAAKGGTGETLIYGSYGDHNGQTWSPGSVSATYQRDGFLVKLRVGLTPSVQSVTLNPNTVPGGLGASSTGTVTLSSAAPGGGADIELTLDNPSASFDPSAPQSTEVITIPAGATTGTFTVYTNAVTSNTAVLVRATYLGSFQVAQLNVVPWLQGIGVTPNTVVGGKPTSGRITLSANAPAGGVVVNLTTDKPSLISFAGGNTVTVPAGLNSVSFTINTGGVDDKTFANVTASVLGVNRTAAVTLLTAKLSTMTFLPTVVAGLGTTTGTITLDGAAGPNGFDVQLSGAPAGYTITPTTIHFGNGDTSRTFTVTTPNVNTNTPVTITATRNATGGYVQSSVSASFTVVPATIASISIDPNTVVGGDTATVTVLLSTPAPASGVVVNMSDSPTGLITGMPAQILIPAGAQAYSFDIQTQVTATNKSVTITASRSASDSKSATLTITGADLVLSLTPSSVSGGTSATGTVTSSRPAPAGGLSVTVSSSNPAVANPTTSTVVIPAGQTSANFTVQTFAVPSNQTVDITATYGAGGATATATLEVRAVGVLSVAFSKPVVTGGQSVSVTITLDAPAVAGGTVVNISATNNMFTVLPASIRVPEGQTTATFTLFTRRVSRDQVTTLTASAAGADASASLLVKAGF